MSWPAPVEVKRALTRVRSAHPYAASGRIARSETADRDSSDLWHRIIALPAVEWPNALNQLTRLEIGLLAYGASARIGEARALDVLRAAVRTIATFAMHRVVFEAYVITSGDATFADSAIAHAEVAGPKLWRFVAGSNDPLHSLRVAYEASSLRLEGWLESDDVRLSRSSHVRRVLRRELLRPPNVSAIVAREEAGEWERWHALEFPGDAGIDWYVAYMRAETAHRWMADDVVLRAFHRVHGAPSATSRTWEKVPVELSERFALWLLNANLTDVLGETDRVRFWRGFLRSIVACWPSRDSSAVFVQMKGWFAVQFVEMGRATYMFLGEVPRPWRHLDIDDLYFQVRQGGRVGRYEHRGRDWQADAHREVLRVTRSHGSSRG